MTTQLAGLKPQVPANSETTADKARLLKRAAEGGVTQKQRQQAHKIGQDFEALFVGMMLKSMRANVAQDKLTGGGHGEEVYRSMLDQEYANAASKSGSFGLGKQIEKEIIRQESRKVKRTVDLTE